MLSCLYIIIAQELKIPIYGVNLPEHFICAYLNENQNLIDLSGNDAAKEHILFYINPYRKGIVFQHSDIEDFLKQLKLDSIPAFYEPCNHKDIIIRVLRNLIFSYEKLGHSDKIEELSSLIDTINLS
jgi:regulator of sirC expression with transglutaminase-like and TPR domain